MNTLILKERFSKAAESYDKASLIQKQIADELFTKLIFLNNYQRILEIGIGTSYLTEKIITKYPQSEIYGLDLAWGMLNKSRKIPKIKLTQADAKELPFKECQFDTVISNLAYQWVGDLEYAFCQVKRVLKEKKKFYFTIFSENTLKELREAISKVYNNGANNLEFQTIVNLPNEKVIESLLTKVGFKNIKIDLKKSKYYYSNLGELLTWLKLIGANKYWLNNLYRGLSARSFIGNIAKYYEEKFKDNGKIFATFDVLFVEAVKH